MIFAIIEGPSIVFPTLSLIYKAYFSKQYLVAAFLHIGAA